jgi:hypothetical protein
MGRRSSLRRFMVSGFTVPAAERSVHSQSASHVFANRPRFARPRNRALRHPSTAARYKSTLGTGWSRPVQPAFHVAQSACGTRLDARKRLDISVPFTGSAGHRRDPDDLSAALERWPSTRPGIRTPVRLQPTRPGRSHSFPAWHGPCSEAARNAGLKKRTAIERTPAQQEHTRKRSQTSYPENARHDQHPTLPDHAADDRRAEP